MRKNLFLFALAGVAALTGCTSDDTPAIPGADGADGQMPIAFATNKANQGRVDPGLETVNLDFGVWAYKNGASWTQTAAENNPTGENVVMNKYLVGYTDGGSLGYTAPVGQDLFDSPWFYESLGKTDAACAFNGGDIQLASHQPNNINNSQYLKYWDLSKAYVNFYACSPYTAASAFEASTNTMTFNAVVDNATEDILFGAATVATAGITAASNPRVPIPFKRLNAKIRMAFYSELDGYEVQIIDYKSADDGIICMPAKKVGAGYSTGEIVVSGKPVVVFNNTGVGSISAWNDVTKASPNVVCPVWFNSASDYSGAWVKSAVLSTSKTSPTYGGLRRVVPSSTNDGFTANISFRLTATDTREVITVYGARVYVPEKFTIWEPNKIYTYLFKITNNLPGTTTGPEDPSVNPSDPGLFPIIFKGCSVQEYDEVFVPTGDPAYPDDAFEF